MKAIFSFVALLVVVAIVAVNVRNELRANKALLPASAGAASDAASAPFGGTSSPSVSQFQQELDKTMKNANERAASAGDAADKAP